MDQNEPCAKSDVFFHMLGLMIRDEVKKVDKKSIQLETPQP